MRRVPSVAPLVVLPLSLLASALPARAAPIDDPARRELLPLGPSATGGAAGGFVNPAAWATAGADRGFAFWWNDRSLRDDTLDNFGFSHAGPLGFAWERLTFAGIDGPRHVSEGTIGLALGDRSFHAGAAWRWATGDADAAGRENGVVLGAIERPARFVSYGVSTFLSAESDRRVGVVDAAWRPLGNPRLTLFADATLGNDQRPDDGTWSAGGEVRPFRGLHLGARVREAAGGGDREAIFHVGLTLGGLGLSVLPGRDASGERATTTFLVRGAPPHRGVPLEPVRARLGGADRWEPVDLERKRVAYRRDLWFDDERVAWIDLARRLRAIREDPLVAGLAVNLAGASIRPSIRWEMRTELARCRAAGKRVTVHLDRAGLGTYWLASVADRVVIDPSGSLRLSGVALRRTYLKGSLEKLGIGFEEHRYFRYKSLHETLVREDMSEADREQLGRIADVLYETIRRDVMAGRDLASGAFDAIVDEGMPLLPERALELGLVDAIGRWPEEAKRIREEEGGRVAARRRPPDGRYPDERWGRPPAVAIVWADGACEMDEGLRGRATSRAMRSLAGRRDVAAVVLRADSPGGDPLPSDLVAAASRKIREAEIPVIVSQGDVAASGGYWISLDSDRILTTPMTVTGSIGVISGWTWDDGFAGKAGLTADGVQRGARADLWSGVRVPFLGWRLPQRNLDDAERALVRDRVVSLYDDFVAKVAADRDLDEDHVREIARGRVWMGEDAVERGLCDETGTLLDAIDVARERAGIDPDQEIRILEVPKRRLFRWPRLVPEVPGMSFLRGLTGRGAADGADGSDEDWTGRYLRALAERPGEAQLLTPPDALPAEWGEARR